MQITGTNLEIAFKALRAQGYLARANFMCCGNCAGTEVANRLSDKIKAAKAAGTEPKLPTGLVFYHQQDLGHVRDGSKTMMLRYGNVGVSGHGDVGKPTIEVGADVVKALSDAGVKYEWDGNPSSCIEVEVRSAFAPVTPPVQVLTGRDLLMATMLMTPGGRTLTTEQYMSVYLLCDGYGTVNEKFAKAQCFDRSHVRDSSPEAVERAVARIESFTAKAA